MSMEKQPEDYITAGETPDTPSGISERNKLPLFFSSPELTQCTDLLRHLTENTDLIPLVKGDEGAGKTTLLFRFQSLAADNWSVCRIDANPMLHPEQLLSQLAHHFGISEEDDRLEEYLIGRFDRLRHDGILAVVAVDDAHLLPPETIAALLQLHSHTVEGDSLLRVVLFALPGISDLLQTQEIQAVNVKGIHTLDIPRLTQEQTGAYIIHALAARSALEAFALTPGQIDKIYRNSQGIPGRIEHLLTKLPAHPTTPQAPSGRPRLRLLLEDLPAPVLLGSFALVAVISLLLIFQDEINSLFTDGTALPEQEQTEEVAKAQEEIPLELPPPVSKQPPTEELASTAPPPIEPAPVEELEPVQEIPEETAPKELAEEAADRGDLTPTPATEPKQPQPVVKATPTKEKIEIKPEPTPVLTPAPAPAPAPAPKATPTPSEKLVDVETRQPPTPKKPPVEAKKAPTPKKKVKKSAEREGWLLMQKPTAYTLQLIGLQDEPSIRAFIRRHRLQGKVAYFKTNRKGQAWFALLYGIYPNREAAIAARSKLPRSLRRPDIWPRSLESVHKEIKAK